MRLVRIFFTKCGEAAYISHLDLQRVMARALRRSGLPVWYSQGFNPHIYMSFALPLPLMHQSLCEMVDIKTESEEPDFTKYIEPLNAALPRGIEATAIQEAGRPAGEIALAEYKITCAGEADALRAAVDAYNSKTEAPVVRKTKRTEATVDLKEYLPEIAMGDGEEDIVVRLPAGGNLNYNPALLCGFLREECGLAALPEVLRTGVFTAGGEPFA